MDVPQEIGGEGKREQTTARRTKVGGKVQERGEKKKVSNINFLDNLV